MVRSKILDGMKEGEKKKLKERLLDEQGKVCFICEEPLDLRLPHDIDHIVPGKDDINNFAVAHENCNREKQDLNLEVARAMKRYDKIRDEIYNKTGKSPDISHILAKYGGSKRELPIFIDADQANFTFEGISCKSPSQIAPILTDEISHIRSFFTSIPIEYVFRDEKDINPRTISDRVKQLVKEFYLQRPQLQVALVRINLDGGHSTSKVFIFDGQHKAAAQILLGARRILVRVFVNPDLELLIQTNERAGTDLRQVAFDLSVRRQIGQTMLAWKIEAYQKDKMLRGDDYSFSEKDLVSHFGGEGKEVKGYIMDRIRNEPIHNKDNQLKDYIAFGGKETEKPLSYSTVNKTLLSLLLSKDIIDERPFFNQKRENEINNMVKIMNLVAEEILSGYNSIIGSFKIEEAVRKETEGKSKIHVPEGHFRSLRMLKEEVMYNWIKHIRQIINNYFTNQGKIPNEDALLQEKFDETLLKLIRNYLKNLKELPIWVNRKLTHIFSAKYTYDYWFSVFQNGAAPDQTKLLEKGLNLLEMIKA